MTMCWTSFSLSSRELLGLLQLLHQLLGLLEILRCRGRVMLRLTIRTDISNSKIHRSDTSNGKIHRTDTSSIRLMDIQAPMQITGISLIRNMGIQAPMRITCQWQHHQCTTTIQITMRSPVPRCGEYGRPQLCSERQH